MGRNFSIQENSDTLSNSDISGDLGDYSITSEYSNSMISTLISQNSKVFGNINNHEEDGDEIAGYIVSICSWVGCNRPRSILDQFKEFPFFLSFPTIYPTIFPMVRNQAFRVGCHPQHVLAIEDGCAEELV